jgi:hypothetical protein
VARNGSGTYSLPQPPFVAGTTIASSAVNSDFSDIAAALTQSISKDGQTVYTGNQPMGGNKLTGLGAGSALTDSVRLSQVADGAINYGGTAGGTADALTLAPVPGITAYAVGQTFTFKAASTNTTAVTVNVSSVGAGSLVWPDGTALAAGDIVSGGIYEVAVSATTPVFHLQNSAKPPLSRTGGTMTGTLTMSGAAINSAVRVDVASATTCDIGGAASNYVRITGTTTITGLGTIASGVYRDVVFAAALTLTHNATSLILQTGANITTVAGDTAGFISEGSGNWRCLWYQRASGQPLSVAPSGYVATNSSVTSVAAAYSSPMTITEGTQLFSYAYTGRNGNTLLIAVDVAACYGQNSSVAVSIFINGATNAVATSIVTFPNLAAAGYPNRVLYSLVSPGTATTVEARVAGFPISLGTAVLSISEFLA